MNLEGRRAFISGASMGLGFEIAKAYVKAGADLMLAARHGATLLEAQAQLKKLAKPTQVIGALPTDVSDPNQVRTWIEAGISILGGIDILVANAGVHGAKGPVAKMDWDEWSTAIDVNLKGTVWQCRAALPHFIEQQYGKIIVLSGGGASGPRPNFSSYAASKAAIVRFAETLAHEVHEQNIDVNAIAPGALNTRLLDDILSAGPGVIGKQAFADAEHQAKEGGQDPERAAQLAVYLGSNASDGITGKWISAIFDPWENFDKLRDQLMNTDVYTMRRIVPEDRQLNWKNEE